jgi:hypothetical protein
MVWITEEKLSRQARKVFAYLPSSPPRFGTARQLDLRSGFARPADLDACGKARLLHAGGQPGRRAYVVIRLLDLRKDSHSAIHAVASSNASIVLPSASTL